jgi:ribosomal protein S18 acetylase RimI-like enzyme
MIEKLQNKDLEVSKNIRSVFQVSYAVEAKLLNAIDFPPLKRNLESYITSDNDFFGYIKNTVLAGIIEIKHYNSFTHIQSLVVDPLFFRQGVAQELMTFVLNSYSVKPFIVETGVKNLPAIKLYKKFNFIEIKQWDTDHGVRKIRFERKTIN